MEPSALCVVSEGEALQAVGLELACRKGLEAGRFGNQGWCWVLRGRPVGVARSRYRAMATLLVAVALISSCRLGAKVPSIVVSRLQANAGPVLRATGEDWLPGERVIIGLAAPNSQPVDSEAVGSALADATGSFVAIVQLPPGSPWSEMAETWVVAHSENWERVVTASFERSQPAATTATPAAVPSAVQPAMAYVLGYVQNVVVEASLIKV